VDLVAHHAGHALAVFPEALAEAVLADRDLADLGHVGTGPRHEVRFDAEERETEHHDTEHDLDEQPGFVLTQELQHGCTLTEIRAPRRRCTRAATRYPSAGQTTRAPRGRPPSIHERAES